MSNLAIALLFGAFTVESEKIKQIERMSDFCK